ncbi:MAG: response regulator [Paraburkholderia sp.]|uniref:response regulator n=1 Tax=Paraburkholderia sp. TaxID=1926495 RepID=UPI003C43A9D1
MTKIDGASSVTELSGGRIVSIVDDDESVRLGTASLVRSLGWRTRTFASAAEFLESEYIGETLCLISDIRMPGMSGFEMHDRLQEIGDAPPTIFTTAFPTDELRAKAVAKRVLALLEKPFEPTAIEHWLNLATDRS